LKDALAAIPRRLKRPLVFTLIGVFTAFYIAMAAIMPILVKHLPPPAPPVHPLTVGYALLMFLGAVHVFALTAFPWQWTGDDRPIAPPLRGAFQAFAFCLTVSLISTLIHLPQIKLTFTSVPATVPRPFLFAMGAMGLLVGAGFNALIGFAMAYWETRKAEKDLAQHQVEEARWTLLKAQMSPHVLLNSLNGLAELVREDPAAAVKGMRDLAEIYHQLLTLGSAPKAPLGQERLLLERYLSVEQLRLGDQLRVEWAWEAGLDDTQVMPLILQPLVENAIKHGIAADPEGGSLRIEVRRASGWLHLAVANTGRAERPTAKPGGGLGLRNLKSRLELAYGGRATFQLVKEQAWTRAELRLPLEVP
jgi:anti-sigma regulatory factor (Ser/Thr protein kinase)